MFNSDSSWEIAPFNANELWEKGHKECHICTTTYGEPTGPNDTFEIPLKTRCGHYSGASCLWQWACTDGHRNCPLCRQPVSRSVFTHPSDPDSNLSVPMRQQYRGGAMRLEVINSAKGVIRYREQQMRIAPDVKWVLISADRETVVSVTTMRPGDKRPAGMPDWLFEFGGQSILPFQAPDSWVLFSDLKTQVQCWQLSLAARSAGSVKLDGEMVEIPEGGNFVLLRLGTFDCPRFTKDLPDWMSQIPPFCKSGSASGVRSVAQL